MYYLKKGISDETKKLATIKLCMYKKKMPIAMNTNLPRYVIVFLQSSVVAGDRYYSLCPVVHLRLNTLEEDKNIFIFS